jgi:hypothetical protein
MLWGTGFRGGWGETIILAGALPGLKWRTPQHNGGINHGDHGGHGARRTTLPYPSVGSVLSVVYSRSIAQSSAVFLFNALSSPEAAFWRKKTGGVSVLLTPLLPNCSASRIQKDRGSLNPGAPSGEFRRGNNQQPIAQSGTAVLVSFSGEFGAEERKVTMKAKSKRKGGGVQTLSTSHHRSSAGYAERASHDARHAV